MVFAPEPPAAAVWQRYGAAARALAAKPTGTRASHPRRDAVAQSMNNKEQRMASLSLVVGSAFNLTEAGLGEEAYESSRDYDLRRHQRV